MPASPLAGFSLPVPFTVDAVAAAPANAGVHVVLDGEEVVYVGESGDLRRRLRQHLTGGRGSSVLHQQVGDLLDASGRVATAKEIAEWLAARTVCWRSTDRRQELKAELVAALQPRFNRQAASGTAPDDALVRDEAAMRADPAKRAQFDRLQAGRYFAAVVATVRAYLRVAIPDADATERDYWALSCLPNTLPGRLSAVCLRRMETLVLHEPDVPAADGVADGFVVVRRSVLARYWPTSEALASAFPGLSLEDSDYVDAGPDQAVVWGRSDALNAAFGDERFAAAIRDLAAPLLGGRTLHWRGHNYQLADQVLDRSRPTREWIYPVNDRSDGWGYDTDVLGFFESVDDGEVSDWYLATCYHQIRAGDRLWIYATAPYRRLVAAGIAWQDPSRLVDTDAVEWRLLIRWDVPLTRFLLRTEPGADLLEVGVQSVRAVRPGESAALAALLRQAAVPAELPRGRLRRLAQVTARQGQADFRRRLLEAYGGRCVISGCDVEAVLQAAHISQYDGPATNQVSNGLLLRADLHNLFDSGLIWIDESNRVRVAEAIVPAYGAYEGHQLPSPLRAEDQPDGQALRQHRIEVAGAPGLVAEVRRRTSSRPQPTPSRSRIADAAQGPASRRTKRQ